jgi:hypothetical protein
MQCDKHANRFVCVCSALESRTEFIIHSGTYTSYLKHVSITHLRSVKVKIWLHLSLRSHNTLIIVFIFRFSKFVTKTSVYQMRKEA